MQKDKIDQELQKRLFSSNTETVVAALQSFKDSGNKANLPLIFDLILSKPAPEIVKEIANLLATVKDKETIPVFIDALQDDKYKSIRKNLATACWQNGLDYSLHMDVFIDLIIQEEWEVAFEAFTVIENFDHFPPEAQYKELKLKMAQALRNVDEQKQYFLEEILKMTAD